VFNGNIPNQYSLPSQTSSYYLKLQPHSRQAAQHISWSQGCSISPHISKPILQTFTPGINYIWQYYQTPKSTITFKQFCLRNNLSTSKSKIASSCHNSSTATLVPLLGTLFNIISHFSNHLAYLPNILQQLRQIHQRGCLSPRSLSSTIHPGQIVLPVPGPSIVPVDNNPN